MIELLKLTILEPIPSENEDEQPRYFSMLSINLDGEVYCESVTLSDTQLLNLFMGTTEAEKAVGMYLIQELIEAIPEPKRVEAREFFYDN